MQRYWCLMTVIACCQANVFAGSDKGDQPQHITFNLSIPVNVTTDAKPSVVATQGNIEHTHEIAVDASSKNEIDNNQPTHISIAQRMNNEQRAQLENINNNEINSGLLGLAQDFFLAHKWGLMGATVVASYLLLSYHLIRQQRFLESPCRWCNWRRAHWSKSDMLKSETFNKWLRDLATTIHVQHMNEKNPFDHVAPASQFLKEVDLEHGQLYNYLFITGILRRIWLTPFFPFSTKSQKEALRRFRHLKRVYRLFLVTLNHKDLYADDHYFNFGHH